MKKTINGAHYDTETANKLAEWDNGKGYNDLYVCYETLYRTETGEYFLHGEGGPGTKYATIITQNSWGSGERLVPFSEIDAREWVEQSCPDEFERIFGSKNENETVQVSFKISRADAEKLKTAALSSMTSQENLFIMWIKSL